MRRSSAVPLVVGLLAAAPIQALAADPLPEGNDGIAAGYPADEGIDGDPDVLFFDDFEGYTDPSELSDRWDAAVYQNDQIQLATDADNVPFGSQSLEFNVPQQDNELSNATDATVSDPVDVLYLRYYSKFEPPFDVVGSSHNGAMISSQYFDNGQATPGIPANGTNKFLVNLEHWRAEASDPSPGLLNVYVYHPEQRSEYGDHFFPSGTVLPFSSDPFDFGPDFVSRPDITNELGAWVCYEYMVQANAVGERDGRIAIWIDGALVADFQNLRFRDTPDLSIDRFGLQFHVGSNPNGPTRKWYDNVVAARSYIGPRSDGSGGDDSDGGSSTSDGGDSDASSDSGMGPTTAGDGSTSGPGSVSSGVETDGPQDSGASDSEGEDADDGSGCGCSSRRRAPAFPALLLLLTIVRRRRS